MPVEVDETYFGYKRKHMPKSKRKGMEGWGPSGKTAVIGVKDGKTKLVSAKVAEDTTAKTLLSFIREAVVPGAEVFTDELHHLLMD